MSDSRKRAKARYFYLKGAESMASEKYEDAYEYFKKAFQTDTTYAEAANEYGTIRFVLEEDTFLTATEQKRNLDLMRKLIDLYPRDIPAGKLYAYYAMQSQFPEEALRVYNILVKEHPGNSDLYYPLSMLYMGMGASDSAVMALREYERLEGATAETTVRKITYLISDGDTVGALREVKAYGEAFPDNPRIVLDQAMIYDALNQTDTAVMVLEKGMKNFPGNADMEFDLGFLYLNKGDSTKFHQLVSNALNSDFYDYEDKLEGLKMYISRLPFKGYDFKESDILVNRITSKHPDYPEVLDVLGAYYSAKNDNNTAFEKLKKATKEAPYDEQLMLKAVTMSLLANRPAEGMKIFEDYPEENVKTTFNAALTYVSAAERTAQYEKAFGMLEKMLKAAVEDLSLAYTTADIAPDSLVMKYAPYDLNVASAAYEVAGDIYTRINKKEDAIRSYENALAIPIDNPSVMNNYAYYIVETLGAKPGTKEFERAKELSRKSLELTQTSPQANYYDTYAWILFMEQDYKDAMDYMEVAIGIEGDDAASEILSHYGDLLFMTGNPEEALMQWQKALDLDPENKLLRKKVEHKTFFYE